MCYVMECLGIAIDSLPLDMVNGISHVEQKQVASMQRFYFSVPNIPLKASPVPRVESRGPSRVESRNGLQQTVRTPRSAEVLTPAPIQVPERAKTMFVDRKSPMLGKQRNGVVDQVQ